MYFSFYIMFLALHVNVGISMEIMGLQPPLIATTHGQSLISVVNISHCQTNRCSEYWENLLGNDSTKFWLLVWRQGATKNGVQLPQTSGFGQDSGLVFNGCEN